MNFPPYKSSNHHTVSLFGRMFFTVTSNSRKNLLHFVDLEESPDWTARFLCTCEAFKYGERPCRHIFACFEAIAFWASVPEEMREEWVDRLMFMLTMGMSFADALQSDYLQELRSHEEKEEQEASAEDEHRPSETAASVAGQRSEGLGKKPKRVYRLAARKGAGHAHGGAAGQDRECTQTK